MQAFKDGDVRFLIATDVAARGIDISGLPYVVNMTLPDVAANYVHRIGRVGRADKMGLAISFVATEKERVWFCQKNVKGRGPGGRAPPCDDTRDYEVGGNCIWYDEQAILRDIEVLLGKSIERMPTDMKLNPDLMQIKFGESKDDGTTQRVSAHLDQLRPVIQKLSSVESSVQSSFLRLRARFNKGTGGK
uniref:Helicase C-terminal domain-containing protein n=1 Tax=Hanusia phi TaxID=3032 RepID=A0A7S0HCK1_9CRYP